MPKVERTHVVGFASGFEVLSSDFLAAFCTIFTRARMIANGVFELNSISQTACLFKNFR